jgi:hypothetical protein
VAAQRGVSSPETMGASVTTEPLKGPAASAGKEVKIRSTMREETLQTREVTLQALINLSELFFKRLKRLSMSMAWHTKSIIMVF